MKIWVNGSVVPPESASVSVLDRGLLYGDGLFETFRTYGARPFLFTEHFRRLSASASFFRLGLPFDAPTLLAAVGDLLRANDLPEAGVRITLTRGPLEGPPGLPASTISNLFIHLRGLPVYPDSLYDTGLTLVTSAVRRNSFSPVSRHKTLNYLDSLLAREEARSRDAHEAVMLDSQGSVAECATANVFAVCDGVLFTPPLSGPILPGVTRATVLRLARDAGLPVREDPVSPDDLGRAAEIFITNSLMELMPVAVLDRVPVGTGRPGSVFAKLHRLYRDFVLDHSRDEL